MEQDNFEEFSKSIRKAKGEKREFKVTNSLGVKQAFFYYRKHRKKEKKFVLNSIRYYEILRRINDLISQELIKGGKVILPERMGELQIEKVETFVKIKDNKLITNRKINWEKTLKLWWEEEECRSKKTLVRNDFKDIIKVTYIKKKAVYINKSYYRFTPHRTLMNKLTTITSEFPFKKQYK